MPHTEYAVRSEDGKITFRSKPWAFAAAQQFAQEHGGVIISREVERIERATDWREISPESVLPTIADCTCVFSCADDPATACSLSGQFHVHPESGACPLHPEAPGDL
jgi:hypothetical protein